MVVDCGPTTPLKLACSHAFWNLSRSEIHRFCGLGGVQIGPGASLFDTLLHAAQCILGLTGEKALKVMSRRLQLERHSQAFAEELLCLDLAVGLFEATDKQGVQDDMQKAQSKLDSLDDFMVEYAAQRQEVVAAKRQKALANRPVLPRILSQQEAKAWNSCKCFHFDFHHQARMVGHFEDFNMIYQTYGPEPGEEQKACKLCIQNLWTQDNESRGLARNDCPFIDLF